jgi:hypothetical protein
VAVFKEMFIQPEEFLYQSPYPVPHYCPFDRFSLDNHTKPFPGVFIPAFEEEKMGRAAALLPFYAPKFSSAQPFAFAEGEFHQTASLCLPLARLLLMTSLPDSVLILTRKP